MVQDPSTSNTVEDSDQSITLRDLLRALRSGWRWVFGTTAVCLAAAFGLTRWMLPEYESHTLLEFDVGTAGGSLLSQLGPLAQLSGLGGGGDEELDTKLGVLGSRRIAEGVVDSLNLNVQLVGSRVPRDSVLRVIRSANLETGALYALTRRPDGSYAVRVKESERPLRVVPVVAPGQVFELEGVTLTLLARSGKPLEKLEIAVHPFSDAVDALRDEIIIERPMRRLVEVGYRTPDRLLAAAIPNVATARLLEYEDRSSKGQTREKVGVLREQAATYGHQLRASEEALKQYREQAGVIEPQSQASEQIRRLSGFVAERDAHQIQRESLARLLQEMQAGTPTASGSSVPAYRKLASFPPFVANGAVQDIAASLIELENERAKLLVLKKEESRDVQGIDRRIEELEGQLLRFGTTYLSSLETQIRSANSLLTGFQADLASVPAREVEFVRLTRETKLLNEIYTYLQTRLKEAEIQEATELDRIHVIDRAEHPRHPISPKPMMNLALAGFFGLMLGTTIAIGRRLSDPRVHRPEEAEAAAGAPVLEVIPIRASVHSNGKGANTAWLPGRSSGSNGETPGPGMDVLSASSDSYSSLWFSLFGATNGGASGVVLISSTAGNDGKSITATGMGIALARQGIRTVLVDADLRQGILHGILSTSRTPGLAELLRGEASVEGVIHPLQLPEPTAGSLHLLPRGGDATGMPAEMFAAPAMSQLLARLRTEFGAVIIDSPPINQVRDGLILRGLVDAMLLVAEKGTTEKQALREASRRIRKHDGSLQGIVLNAPIARPSGLSNLPVLRLFT